MTKTFEKQAEFTKKVTDLPDHPSPGMTAAEIKTTFQTPADELKTTVNNLVDALNQAKVWEEDRIADNAISTRTIKQGAVTLDKIDPAIISQPGDGIAEQAKFASIDIKTTQVDLLSGKRIPFNDKLSVTVHNYNQQIITNFIPIKNTGFKYVRDDLQWDMVETTKGVYNFSSFEININNMIRDGITPMMILGYGNPLYTNAEMADAFITYVDKATQYFAGKGIIWEIYNEPNWSLKYGSGFTRDYIADTFAYMVIGACKKIRTNDKAAFIIAPGLANDNDYYTERKRTFNATTFLDEMGKRSVFDYLDGVSIHPYTVNQQPENLLGEKIAMAKATIKKYTNREIPIFITEMGYTTADRSAETKVNGYPVTMSEQNQADYICRVLLLADMYGVPITNIYGWMNKTKTYSTPAQTNIEQNWGLVYSDWVTNPSRVKPVQPQLSALTTALNGFTFAERVSTPKNDYVLKYVNDSMQVKYVYWTTDTTHTLIVDGQTFNISSTPTVSAIQATKYVPSTRLETKPDGMFQLVNRLSGRMTANITNQDLNNCLDGKANLENSDGLVLNAPPGVLRGKFYNLAANEEVPEEAYQLVIDIDTDIWWTRKRTGWYGAINAWQAWVKLTEPITDTGWKPLTLSGTFGGSAEYRQMGKRVHLRGNLTNSSWTSNSWLPAFTLPSGIAPSLAGNSYYPGATNGVTNISLQINHDSRVFSVWTTDGTKTFNVGINHISFLID